MATSLLFNFDLPIPAWQNPQYYVRQFALLCIASAAAFAVTIWPQRQLLAEAWLGGARAAGWRVPLVANIALFIGLTIATIEFSRHFAVVEQPHWGIYGAYLVPLVATGLSLLWVAAPLSFWRTLFSRHPLEIVIAVAAGLSAIAAGVLTQTGWKSLAGMTLLASHHLLSLYEADARVDYDRLLLGIGDFQVHIDDGCSGYEGIGLVTAFLGLFLWVFRRSLVFPNAFVLFPIGIVAIWLLNAVRITTLVSLGAHVSPEVAISGFHSQAGWIAFLFVTIGVMAVAPRLAILGIGGRSTAVAVRPANDRAMRAFLVPFMALMAASIVVAACAPYDTWLYGLKVAAIGVCLWAFRDVLLGLIAPVQPVALGCGALVGALWIVTAPAGEQGSGLATWIAAQPVWLAALWLGIRGIGSIVMVPVAEELAFRGMLHRWLISRRFEAIDFGQFSWLAFAASSLLFGIVHQRWLAGALAGAAFALLMYRSNRLSDPIAAHMAANAVIFAWAVAAGNWSLL